MKQLVDLIRHTRRFRYTLTLLLMFGALFAVTQTRSQEPDPAEAEKEQSQESQPDAVQPEKAEALDQEKQAAGDGSAKPDEVKEDEELSEQPLEEKAEQLLRGLSKHLSDESVAEDAKLPASLIDLTVDTKPEKAKDDALHGLHTHLGDPEKAGQYIHDLRMRGFVPVESIRWIQPVADPKEAGEEDGKDKIEPDAVLWGIITVDDKENPEVKDWEPRSRAVKISFVKQGEALRISSVERPSARELGGIASVENFLQQLKSGEKQAAWSSGSKVLMSERDAEEFYSDMEEAGFLTDGEIKWGKETAIEGGYKVNAELHAADGVVTPFYVALLETKDGLKVMDFQSTQSFLDRVLSGRGDTLDMILAVVALALILVFLYILVSYVRGLKGSPRELYILFFTKLTEYSAYGAAQLTFMFYLRKDLGLSDVWAGTYYSAWSTTVTAVTMVVGAICDTIGVKKTLLIGSVFLLISRVVMPFADNFWIVLFLGFIPLGIGVAITGPVLSVGIKRFTTIEGAALGFGLFYTLMNVGWAVGAKIFDVIRIRMGEMGSVDFLGDTLSTWQVLLGIGFFINLPDLLAILWMRDGVEMTEHGIKFPDKKKSSEGADAEDGSMWQRAMDSIRSGAVGSVKLFGENFVQRAFWVFILLIGITVFARLTFFHFHITWPSYGIRYFGQGSLVGNVFGVLNPLLIVFMVPVVAYLTRKVRSYWLLLVGTIISVASTVFVVLPPEVFAGLADTWFGIVVYERWLEVPVGNRDPYYLSMVLFVIVFTIGEAIWSPRLMQFTAEIAPPGREGSYISLSYLPYFGAKFIVGPMAGMLLAEYSPEFGVNGIYGYYPDHQMIWWWVGGTAALTPIGLLAFKKLYRLAEARAEEAAKNE